MINGSKLFGIHLGFSQINQDLWDQIGLKYLKFITLKLENFDKSSKIFSVKNFVVQYGFVVFQIKLFSFAQEKFFSQKIFWS